MDLELIVDEKEVMDWFNNDHKENYYVCLLELANYY